MGFSSHSREFSGVQRLTKRAANGGNFQAPQNTCCNSSPLSMLFFLTHSRQTWFDFVVCYAQFSLPHSSTHPTHKASAAKTSIGSQTGNWFAIKKNVLLILFFRCPFGRADLTDVYDDRMFKLIFDRPEDVYLPPNVLISCRFRPCQAGRALCAGKKGCNKNN